jgi:hypothetical protein
MADYRRITLFLIQFIGATILLASGVMAAIAVYLHAWVYLADSLIGVCVGGWVMWKPRLFVSGAYWDSIPPPDGGG